MPIHYAISTDLDLAYARWSGRVDIAQFRKMFASYVQDQNYVMGRPELCDFSGLTAMDVGFQQVWSALSFVNSSEKQLVEKTRCVVYAPGDTAFGVARMYQSLSEYEGGVVVTVCREEAEALSVLDKSYTSLAELLEKGDFQQPKHRTGVLT